MNKLYLDFETRSTADLPTCGVHVYAASPFTEVLCLAYAFDDEPVQLWLPGEPHIPGTIHDHIRAGYPVIAHNAQFELAIWNHTLSRTHPEHFIELDYKQVECTMAMAYAMALPGALEKAAHAMGLPYKKDMQGHRVMLQLSQPKATINEKLKIVWHSDPEKYKILYRYCMADVEVERALYKRLLKLSPAETKVWQLDQEINNRGIPVDRAAAKRAQGIVRLVKERLDKRMQEVTNHAVGTCAAVGQLKNWIEKDKCLPDIDGVAKNDIIEILKRAELPNDVREALTLRQEASKSSTAKLTALLESVGKDGRVRGTMQYHGAATGRWSGRRLQIQNFPRQKLKPTEIADIFAMLKLNPFEDEIIEGIEMLYGPTLSVLSECLRGFIVATEGKTFMAADFSSIEARVLAWLAGEERLLNIFRTHGKIYEDAASRIYGIPTENIGKDSLERQIGKVAILSLGYGGGVGAFQKMAPVYGVTVPDEDAESIKEKWRAAHPAIVNYWYRISDAAMNAVKSPGSVFSAGPPGREVKYRVSGSFLFCRLPSGRVICYPYPRIKLVKTPWGQEKDAIVFMSEDSLTHQWGEKTGWYGLLVENIVQAVARDFMVNSMFEAEAAGFPIVFTVHDEAVAEVPKEKADLDRFIKAMETLPAWAKDFPLSASGWVDERYRK